MQSFFTLTFARCIDEFYGRVIMINELKMITSPYELRERKHVYKYTSVNTVYLHFVNFTSSYEFCVNKIENYYRL